MTTAAGHAAAPARSSQKRQDLHKHLVVPSGLFISKNHRGPHLDPASSAIHRHSPSAIESCSGQEKVTGLSSARLKADEARNSTAGPFARARPCTAEGAATAFREDAAACWDKATKCGFLGLPLAGSGVRSCSAGGA